MIGGGQVKIKDLADEPPYYLKGVSRYMWRRLVPFLKRTPMSMKWTECW